MITIDQRHIFVDDNICLYSNIEYCSAIEWVSCFLCRFMLDWRRIHYGYQFEFYFVCLLAMAFKSYLCMNLRFLFSSVRYHPLLFLRLYAWFGFRQYPSNELDWTYFCSPFLHAIIKPVDFVHSILRWYQYQMITFVAKTTIAHYLFEAAMQPIISKCSPFTSPTYRRTPSHTCLLFDSESAFQLCIYSL